MGVSITVITYGFSVRWGGLIDFIFYIGRIVNEQTWLDKRSHFICRPHGWKNPGKSRANHYHREKEEWFAVVSGRIEVRLRHVVGGDSASVLLDTEDPACRILYIPPFVAHSIRNPHAVPSTLVVFSKSPENREDTIPFDVDG